jgi:hydroxymethylpyrimidine pyrophosphatase-like HAD family hydrolase
MSTFMFDVDGTLVHYHTQEWLPGAKELLRGLLKEGHTIVIVTARGEHDAGQVWSIEACDKMFADAGFERSDKFRILYNIPWDRHILDDAPCHAHNRARNASWLEYNPLFEYHSLPED